VLEVQDFVLVLIMLVAVAVVPAGTQALAELAAYLTAMWGAVEVVEVVLAGIWATGAPEAEV